MRKNKKMIGLLLAMTLVLGCTIGGTLAWLMDTTGTVINTFTVGNIAIDLKEHDLKSDGTLDTGVEVTSEDTYKIIPGTSQPKDPFVRVEAGSEACWVFIKVEEVNGASSYITYDIDDEVWTELNEGTGIYYKEQSATTSDEILNILKDKKVSYSNELEKDDIDKLYTLNKDSEGNVISMTVKDKEELPQLKFTAYAIQQTKADGTTFTAADAWAELNPSTTQ